MTFRRLWSPLLLVGALVLSVTAFLVMPAHAQITSQTSAQAPDLGLEYPATAGLTNADPRILAANIIRAAMGLLGVVALVIILIAGFDWMTAGGNDEKISMAKQWMRAGVIGLMIILGAYSITSFIVSRLVNATTAGDSSITP